ncbi:hypothetical protein HQQ80_06645 [Microbacteriaceae bacterium VKM Ac-2855]|nr:hypothetical protein [Microbacteriaceae bacterium VKM Ac-2855]
MLHALLLALEEPGAIDRGFAQHVVDQIDDILHATGEPRRSGPAQPMRAAVETDETGVVPPGSL